MPSTSENASIRSGAIRRSLERLEKLVADVVARIVTLETRTATSAWTAQTLGSGWSNYGGGYQTAQIRTVGDKVQCRGIVTHAAGDGTTVFTLAAGRRPPAHIQPVIRNESGVGYFNVESTGIATIDIATGTTAAVSYLFEFSTTA